MPPSPKNTYKKKVKIVITLIFLSLFALEISLRIFADRNSKFNFFIGEFREWDAKKRYKLKKNYKGKNAIEINSRGFLGPEFEIKKKKNTRIVVLGASTAFSPATGNFPSFLQEETAEVINASVPGYDSGQAKTWYLEEIDKYEHNIVIIALGGNDMGQYGPEGLRYKLMEKGYIKKPTFLDKVRKNYHTLRFIHFVKGYMNRGKKVDTSPLDEKEKRLYINYYPEHFEKNILEIIKIAKAKNRKVFLLNFPGLITENSTVEERKRMNFARGLKQSLPKFLLLKKSYNSALEKVAKATKTRIIDIESIFDTPKKRLVFNDSSHHNEIGSKMIADKIKQAIKEK